MREIILESGAIFGRLTVISPLDEFHERGQKVRQRTRMYRCFCTCGNEVTVRKDHLMDRRTVSCGCKAKEERSAWGKRQGAGSAMMLSFKNQSLRGNALKENLQRDRNLMKDDYDVRVEKTITVIRVIRVKARDEASAAAEAMERAASHASKWTTKAETQPVIKSVTPV